MPTFSDTDDEARDEMNKYVGANGHFSHCRIGDAPHKRNQILDDLFAKYKENGWNRLTGLEKSMVLSWLNEAKLTGYIRMELVTLLCMPPRPPKNFRFEDMKPGATVTFDLPPTYRR
jgi:hypothetical protein